MIKYLFAISVLVFFTNCGSTSTKEQEVSPSNTDFKIYHSTSRDLSEGYVRVFSKKTKEGIKTNYRLVKDKSNKKFIEINYDENFNKKSELIYIKKENGFVENKIVFYKSGVPKEIEILLPKLYPYDSENQDCESKYIFKPTEVVTLKYFTNTTFVGTSSYLFNKQEIKCIELKTNTKMESGYKSKRTIGNAFYGEGIGFVKSINVNGKDTIITELIEIIEVSEFEKRKNNS